MSSSVLAAQNPCSPCGGTNSWKAQDCNSGSVYYYLDQQDGYLNNNLIVLQYGYSVGDVVWVRQYP